jgi:hypothetical protein
MPTLAVVGAGPKGIAIAAKARALATAGLDGERWRLTVEPGEAIWADGVVVTGAGPPIRVAGQPGRHPRIFDGRTYWLAGRAVSGQVARNVCVIGSGETAASVVINLLSKSHRRSAIDVVTSLGRRIEPDLSVAGLNPPLHLPVVAGLAQGPGFPNLSCLGLLSDRILRRYVTRAAGAAGAADVTEAADAAGTAGASQAAGITRAGTRSP